MSSNPYLSTLNDLFEHLQQLDHISREISQFFIQQFKFLDIFLSLQSFTDEPDMLHISQKVQALFQDALVDFSKLHQAEYFDFCIFNKIWLIKMEIRAKYSFPKISPLPLISAKKNGIAIPKFVMDFMDTVVEILGDLVDDPCSFLLYVPETKEHVEDILKELKLLRTFVCFVSERFIEPQSQHLANFFTHVLAVTGHASMLVWLYFSSCGYENDQDVIVLGEINVFLFSQMKFKPIQPSIRKIYIALLEVLKSTIQSGGCHANIQIQESTADIEANFLETIQHNLAELPTICNISQSDALKDQSVILKEMLDILRADIIHVPIRDLEVLLRDIDTSIIDVGLVVYSLYEGGEEEEEEKEVMAPGEVNPALVLDLLGNIQQIIITQKYLPIREAFHSNYWPRIHGLGYVDFILKNLKEFQSRHLNSIASTAKLLQRIQKELESWQPFLEFVAEEQHNDINKIQHCATQLIGKAYEIEYLIDSCICRKALVWYLERWFLDIVEDTILVKDKFTEIHEKKIVEDAMNTVIAHTASNLERFPKMNEEIVGFHDVIENLRGQLVKGTKGRDVISIVGMPGLGKTTLAYRLYSDRSIVSYFDIRAMCCVSQIYSRKHLLLAILRDVSGEDSRRRKNHADELANELRKALFSKRYLILVDDVWEASVWDDLIGCFHDGNNGSRIILTTRNNEVANYARSESDPLQLRMFNDDESWELLRKKVFGDESFPPPLTEVGQKIAKKCGRLPLSIALVAGILAETEKKEECWEQVANNLGPRIHKDSRAIIEQSYQVLPYRLRSCFLYFGAFLEDSVINVSKLTRLWISEGFVKSCEGKSLEDIAEGYLGNLIGRNLVMGTKISSRSKIKACRIHDLLHDFCKVKAKEENLVQWIKWEQNGNPSSNVSYLEQLAHRMSIYGEDYHIGESSSYLSHVGSFIMHNRAHLTCRELSHFFFTYKFLKVLDLEFTTIDWFPTNLVYLRYFAAETKNLLDTSSITNCWNLETLILHNTRVISLPLTLWNMVNLRHLHISRCSFNIKYAKYSLESSKSLYGLRTFSAPYFSCVEDAELILRKTPNLRELNCTFLDEDVDKFQYQVLNFPTEIEMLEICTQMFRKITIPICISAPSLKNLTLEGYCLHPQHLSTIALLQNLQVLEMKRVAFDKVWEVSNGNFPELNVLKLQGIDGFEEWDVTGDEAFPKLDRLVLLECGYLKEIPSAFGEIYSLKYIEVRNCPESVGKSARDIREIQVEDYQNTGFEIFIH